MSRIVLSCTISLFLLFFLCFFLFTDMSRAVLSCTSNCSFCCSCSFCVFTDMSHTVLGCTVSLLLCCCCFTNMSHTVLGCTISLVLGCVFCGFFFYRHVTYSAGLYSLTAPLLLLLFYRHVTHNALLHNLTAPFSFSFCLFFTDMSRAVLGSTISLLLFFFSFFFLFYRHVTHSAGLYNLTAPVFFFLSILQTCHAQCWALQSHSSFFSFFFFRSFLQTCHAQCWALQSHCSCFLFFVFLFVLFFVLFYKHFTHSAGLYNLTAPVFFFLSFFTDMSRAVLGCSIAAAAVMLACLISLMCGVWPARCDPVKKPRLYLATSILLLLASESSTSVLFSLRRYPSAR